LKSLDNRLGRQELVRVGAEAQKLGKTARIRAYLDVIARANKECLKEVMMSGSSLTLEKIFRDTGFLDKWIAEGKASGIAEGEARGEERKAEEIAKNMLRNGFSSDQTAVLSGLDIAKIKTLSEVI
jgi:predicted transposase YdaD